MMYVRVKTVVSRLTQGKELRIEEGTNEWQMTSVVDHPLCGSHCREIGLIWKNGLEDKQN